MVFVEDAGLLVATGSADKAILESCAGSQNQGALTEPIKGQQKK
jgi:hypothetical protein